MGGAPKTTVWQLDPHTRAKHAILHTYLQAWVPILTRGGFPLIVYIDGFAGPGRYSKGEEGSPVLALRAAIEQREPISAEVWFLFIEKDEDRAAMLEQVVAEIDKPDNFKVRIRGGETFEDAFDKFHDHFRKQGKAIPPTFAFIDPFGWVGVPFRVVKEVAAYKSCEVLINFMYEEINRFLAHPEQGKNFDEFFGTDEWRKCTEIKAPRERNRFLHDLYQRQLIEEAGLEYVRSFEMRNDKDVTDYFLFYGTKSYLGLKKMKEAMWRVDEAGEFRFSDATDPNQLVLFEKAPQFEHLRRQILAEFGGRTVTVEDIERFVVTKTAFRETHFKTQVLRKLEKESLLESVDAPDKRRTGTYADSALRLRFR